MIYYFTGTGNSLWCARTIADALGEKVENLAPYQDKQLACSDEVVGFVLPTYMGDVPWLVKKILIAAKLPKASYTFVVMTSNGGASGSAFANMDVALVSAGGSLDAAFDLQMPGICVLCSPEDNAARLSAAPAKVAEICEALKRRTRNYASAGTPAGAGFVEGTYFYGEHSLKRLTLMKNFEVTADCNGCGTCARICPTGNIRIENGRAVHGTNCAACYACLHWCPKHATLVKVPTIKHRFQYHHPEVKLDDMMERDI